ncbi:NPR2-domain-containing protein [Metschnikowia bicuspidata var. bicuspidata NRRL YB-4993]|uniref:NPR2-domain-containing protein n=1 Tax=Metschnikowia bicuspidata var. bicuspidata NRRL YB-4993 TaxID=869754 RepID=A0A1A0H7B6_9ASCO|nr:NPR2-domain-containing protein [Metschnikowia bicuspidata var. bicuspidata NRRL YB-4993]OBA19793.1 NPR2-domain-containing protein [Metschnikowia bicuspidata var. bicuspidata NRRL YB-4993]
MISNDGFVPITAIFYSVFHPVKGTQIVHQVPEGSIGSYDLQSGTDVLFNFDTVKNYIIPKPQLCNKLVSLKINEFRVLGYPVNIEGSHYSRNSFNFNFGFVLPYNSDTTPYELAVSRMGKMFRALEEQSLLLSKLDKEHAFFSGQAGTEFSESSFQYTPGHSKIQKFSLLSIESLIHQLYQDLNNYSECCIPIDSANSVDIKLFPMLPPPVNLKAYQVPVLTVKLDQLIDVVWDPTMVKILPYVNGLNSVKKISELADADYLLTKQCIQHLMHYQCIILVDVFQFSNIYAPTNHIGNFLKTNGMAEECQAYIITTPHRNESAPFSSRPTPDTPRSAVTPVTPSLTNTPNVHTSARGIPSHSRSQPSNEGEQTLAESASPLTRGMTPAFPMTFSGKESEIKIPSKATLFYLYRLLNQGQSIKEWYIQHQKALSNIDIRRFINFGVVRGIIYRVNLYPILHWVTKSLETGNGRIEGIEDLLKSLQNKAKINSALKKSAGPVSEAGLLKSVVRESNLKTGRKTRTVSFNYHVDHPVSDPSNRDRHKSFKAHRNSSINSHETPHTEHDETTAHLDLDVFDSDSDELLNGISNKARGNRASSDLESVSSGEPEQLSENDEIIKVIKLVRGSQHFDSICTELQKSRADVEKLFDKIGAHSVINA